MSSVSDQYLPKWGRVVEKFPDIGTALGVGGGLVTGLGPLGAFGGYGAGYATRDILRPLYGYERPSAPEALGEALPEAAKRSVLAEMLQQAVSVFNKQPQAIDKTNVKKLSNQKTQAQGKPPSTEPSKTYYHGTSEVYDTPKSMRQLRLEGADVKPSNVSGDSPFFHLTDDKSLAESYAFNRASNMGGTKRVSSYNVAGSVLDLSKHPADMTPKEKVVLEEIGRLLYKLSNGRGSDAKIGGEMISAGRNWKHSMDARLPNVSYFDIEHSQLLPEILKKYGFSGVNFIDRDIIGRYKTTTSVLPEMVTSIK
jgi:hypothetical protein